MAQTVSLTSGMRSNLVSLQQTNMLLNRTQERLSTGQKVNSALDNPVNFFTSQAHLSRAADLALLKDGMNEAVQTVKAADAGIKQITELIQAAKGLGQSALSADKNQVEITIGTMVAGNTITIGGTVYTATAADVTAGANEFNVGSSSSSTASNLAALINSTVEGTKDIAAKTNGAIITLEAESSSDTITAVSQAAASGTNVTIGASVISDRAELAKQYESLVVQINALASDAGYKGINLLKDDDLSVRFEGSSLDVNGFTATVSELGANSNATGATAGFEWSLNSEINTDINKLDGALGQLRTESSKLATNLSIINARQSFSDDMIKTLNIGSDNLVLADMNEEGANMLMLQTRQALGTTALSLSSQAAQSVLRLF